MTLSSRLPTRGRVAAAALVLPLLAVAGCAGATQAERASVQDDLQAAQSALQSSKAASFTLHLEDPQGTLKKAMTSGAADSAVPGATADALVGGSVSWTVDPVGTSTLADVQKADKAAPLGQQLSRSNLALRVDAGGGAVAQLRLVDGVAYLNVGVKTLLDLARAGGAQDAEAQLQQALASAPEAFRPLLTDVQAGTWVKVPLAPYLDQLQAAAGATPSPSVDPTRAGQDLLAAVRPFVAVTDAGDDGGSRRLDVRVQAKKALQAALGSLKGMTPALPGLEQLDTTVLDRLGDGTVDGTVTLADRHLTRLDLDLASAARLAPADQEAPDLAGSKAVVEVDDTADAVTAPTDVSSVDVSGLISQLLAARTAGGTAGA